MYSLTALPRGPMIAGAETLWNGAAQFLKNLADLPARLLAANALAFILVMLLHGQFAVMSDKMVKVNREFSDGYANMVSGFGNVTGCEEEGGLCNLYIQRHQTLPPAQDRHPRNPQIFLRSLKGQGI